MAHTVYLEDCDGYVLVREISDLSDEERGTVQTAIADIVRSLDDDGNVPEDHADVTVAHLYMMADVFTFLPADTVRDLGPKAIADIINAATDDTTSGELDGLPAEAI